MTKLHAILAGALALTAAVPAAASSASTPDTRSIDVRVGSLDLSNRDHARQFDRQLRAAARQVCAELNPFASRGTARIRCEFDALSGARRDAAAIRLQHEARH